MPRLYHRKHNPIGADGILARHSYKIDYSGRFRGFLKCCKLLKINGRGERIRTSDPLVPNQVLYQAEPLPDMLVSANNP
jgi:hypothetical protein